MRKLLVIVGPTGSGKTSLALNLLDKVNAEIVSADSRQVYKRLDYITNKLGANDDGLNIKRRDGFWIQDGKAINLYDVVDITQTYSVSRFIKDAIGVLDTLWSSGKDAFLVGGTGFYIDALLGRVPFGNVPADNDLRANLLNYELSRLQSRLKNLDERFFMQLSSSELQNKQRLIRYIEVATYAGNVKSGQEWSPLKTRIGVDVDVKHIGLKANNAMLYEKSDKWIDWLTKTTFFKKELSLVKNTKNVSETLIKGMIFREGLDWLDGKMSLEEAKSIMKGRLHRYIRSQLRWFGYNKQIDWFDISANGWRQKVEEKVLRWYS